MLPLTDGKIESYNKKNSTISAKTSFMMLMIGMIIAIMIAMMIAMVRILCQKVSY